MPSLTCMTALASLIGATAAAGPPPPPSPCDAALKSACSAALAKCASFPCQGCEMCIISNQTTLGKAGCTPAQETAFCAAPAPIPPPPPLACTHTDSHGDSYDLSGVPKVDGLWKTIDNRPSYYHVGICSAPTQSATDPTVGCLPPCDPPCTGDMPCECKSKRAIDQGNEAVCQFDGKKSAVSDPNKAIVQYNLGLLKSGEQKWADGPTPGGSVSITYEGGSTRGGCGDVHRQTEILVECDPCKLHNITKVVEPTKCHYQLTVSSIAGCPTNKPLPAGSCPHICDKTTYQCKPAPPGAAGANATLAECSKSCKKVVPPPPPPLSRNPCIRFGHTIPVAHSVDVQIVQDPPGPQINHTWTNFKFGDFSDWVNVFKPGTGTITIWENVGGTRGAQLYSLKGIPLTPGPLVTVIKVAASQTKNTSGYWPPSLPDSVETIAASYVDTDKTSKVRLFNLAPDTAQAGMTSSAGGGKEIASNIAYGLGSNWIAQPTASTVYGFKDDTSGKSLTTHTVTPAAPPIGNTNVLVGLQSATGTFGVQVVPLVDAPEGGTCHP